MCLEYHDVFDRDYAMFVPSHEDIVIMSKFAQSPIADRRKKPAKMVSSISSEGSNDERYTIIITILVF